MLEVAAVVVNIVIHVAVVAVQLAVNAVYYKVASSTNSSQYYLVVLIVVVSIT